MADTIGEQRQERCPLLELPLEMRLNIFDIILGESDAVTISGREVAVKECQTDGTAASGSDFKRIRRIPIIKNYYDESLLAVPIAKSAVKDPRPSFADVVSNKRRKLDMLPSAEEHLLASTSKTPVRTDEESSISSTDGACIPTHRAILLTCKQLNEELQHHMSPRRRQDMTLYVTYPHGLPVLKEHFPYLVRQARAINISGTFSSYQRTHVCTSRWCCSGHAWHPSHPLGSTQSLPTTTIATEALIWLVRSVLSPAKHPIFQRLDMRIYYPDPDSYREVWSNDQSPISVALPNICGGNIDMEVWRSKLGAGVFLRARPSPRSRCISTGWRRLGESTAENEGFVISEQWGKTEDDIPEYWKDSDRKQEAKVGLSCYSGTRFSGNGGSY